MRTMLIGILAAAGIATAVPAAAQGFYFGAPGVEVGVGSRYHGSYDSPRYRSYYGGPRHRDYDRSYAFAPRCRTVIIERDDGTVRRIRRCR